jgi:glycosyltransferase involved in cell wall biosynthesis
VTDDHDARTPKISVCVPTFNRSVLLEQCVASLVRQTREDIEILVSDNCSSDDTAAIVASFNDPRLQYFRNSENIGAVGNINRVIGRARGEYVVIAHDDDLYLPEFLDQEATLLDAYPNVGMVHCAAIVMGADGALTRRIQVYPRTVVRSGALEFERYLEGHNVVCPTVMVRRAMYEKVGLWDPKYMCTDFHLWLRLALCGDVGYVAESLVHLRVHPDSRTNELTAERWYTDFMAIVTECMGLAATAGHGLSAERTVLHRRAARRQGKRFFVAATSEIAKGRFSQAREYVAVLERCERDGLSRGYVTVARWLTNRPGQAVIRAVRSVWRATALMKQRFA